MTARIRLFLKGFCMGVADVIPGVSGGTMALVLGIYTRLIDAISGVGLSLLRSLFRGSFWRQFFAVLVNPAKEDRSLPEARSASDMAFLAVLLLGIVAAALTGVRFIPGLLTEHPQPTLGFFMGLVLASVVIPYRLMGRRSLKEGLAFVVSLVATTLVLGLGVDSSGNARGQVELSLAPAAVAGATAPVVLPAAEVRLSTARYPDKPRREVVFEAVAAESAIVLPLDGSAVVVPIRAQMSSAAANVGPGEVQRIMVQRQGRDDIRVAQPAPVTGGTDPSLLYIFLCGAIAISAMILPGISGSFILLLLGQYFYVIFTVSAIIYDRDLSRLPVLLALLGGIVVGILAFSRLLSWLLARFHSIIMAVLVGLMLGSLRNLWPFQTQTASGAENHWPRALDGTVWVTLLAFAVGMAAVLTLDFFGRRQERATAGERNRVA
jgi:putative membrane protein